MPNGHSAGQPIASFILQSRYRRPGWLEGRRCGRQIFVPVLYQYLFTCVVISNNAAF